MKYSDLTLGKAEAVFNKLGGLEGVEKFLSNQVVVIDPRMITTSVTKQVVNYGGSIYDLISGTTYDISGLRMNGEWPDDYNSDLEGSPKEVIFGVFKFGNIEFKLSVETIIDEMNKRGFRPAGLFELFSFNEIKNFVKGKEALTALKSEIGGGSWYSTLIEREGKIEGMSQCTCCLHNGQGSKNLNFLGVKI